MLMKMIILLSLFITSLITHSRRHVHVPGMRARVGQKIVHYKMRGTFWDHITQKSKRLLEKEKNIIRRSASAYKYTVYYFRLINSFQTRNRNDDVQPTTNHLLQNICRRHVSFSAGSECVLYGNSVRTCFGAHSFGRGARYPDGRRRGPKT